MPDNPFLHPAVRALRDHANIPPPPDYEGFGDEPFMTGDVDYEGEPIPLPLVATPPDFRGRPFVTGSPDFARKVEHVMRLLPEAAGQVDSVFQGKGPTYIDMLGEEGKLDYMPYPTTLYGVADHDDRSIEVDASNDMELGTLVHEFSHLLGGKQDEPHAREVFDFDDDHLYGDLPEELRWIK